MNGFRQWWHCLLHFGHRPLRVGDGSSTFYFCQDCEWEKGR